MGTLPNHKSNASRDFQAAKTQNTLLDAHLDRIVSTFEARQAFDKYAYVASLAKITENDFNLNIPRYIDTFEE